MQRKETNERTATGFVLLGGRGLGEAHPCAEDSNVKKGEGNDVNDII